MIKFLQRNLSFILLLSLYVHTPYSYADKFYKWTDEKGNIHFSDTIPKQPLKTEEISVSPPKPSSSEDNVKKRPQPNKAESAANEETSSKEQANQTNASESSLNEKCQQIAKNLTTLKSGQRLINNEKNTKSKYLSDSDRLKRIEQAQNTLKQYCN